MRNTVPVSKRAKATPSPGLNDEAATGTITSVAGDVASTTILAANGSRHGLMIYNDSDAILKLALSDTTASATNFSDLVLPHGRFFLMEGAGKIYTGKIVGIWASATGAARVTEFT